MAIVLEAHYAKKLGLPGYSSHQYSVSIRTELTDLSQVESESGRLYRLLQDAVDREIQDPGFMPKPHPITMDTRSGSAVKNRKPSFSNSWPNTTSIRMRSSNWPRPCLAQGSSS